MTRFLAAFVAVAVTLILAGPPARADCEAGFEAFDSADYEQALRHLLPCARAGDPAAQFEVGVLYEFGRGVPQDDAEAVRWYRLAADQGIAEAQFNLGVKYSKGEGVSQDEAKAVHWYRLAAEHGDAGAQYNLAVRYYYGQGTLQDDMSAYMWSNLAAARLPQGELRNRAVDLRDDVAGRLSPAERARGQERARNWRPRVTARAEREIPDYATPGRGEPPRTQRQAEPNPFRAALELRARQNREVQQFLADLGYDPGPVDGVIGPRTRAAVRAFQADAGLPVDGEISDELYAALTDVVSSGQSVAARSVPTERRLDSTGTGFVVSQNGDF